jgi:hypothetical protein
MVFNPHRRGLLLQEIEPALVQGVLELSLFFGLRKLWGAAQQQLISQSRLRVACAIAHGMSNTRMARTHTHRLSMHSCVRSAQRCHL